MFYAQYPPTGGGGGVTSLNGLTGALTLVPGAGISITPSGSTITIAATGGSGTVTSVGLADNSSTPIYSISGSPVTTSGTLAFTLINQSANVVLAGPATGAPSQPTFRTLVAADIPSLAYANQSLSNLTSPTSVNQSLLPSSGGTFDLGSNSDFWNHGFIEQFLDSSNNTSIDIINRNLDDSTAATSVNWNARLLEDSSGETSVDWANRLLVSSSGATMLDYSTAGTLNASTNRIINVVNPVNPQDAATKAYVDAIPSGANQHLSNLLSPTAINQDLIFDEGAIATIQTKDDATTATQDIQLKSGAASVTGKSGDLNLETGPSVDTASGQINVFSGAPSNPDISSGGFVVSTGAVTGVGTSGLIQLLSGSAVDGASGSALLSSGPASGVGGSGNANVITGDTASGSSGNINVNTGNPSGAGGSGNINILSGNSAGSTSGQITLQTGTAGSASNSGNIALTTAPASGGAQSGSIVLDVGTVDATSQGGSIQLILETPSLGGTRGTIQFQDGSQGTAGQVWVSTDTNGSGHWAAAATVSGTNNKELFTLNSTNIANQYIDLSHIAKTNSIDFLVQGAGTQIEGASFDYSVNYTGGVGGNTRITFLNGLATGGSSALVAGDVVVAKYQF